jgi:hypothetical protein
MYEGSPVGSDEAFLSLINAGSFAEVVAEMDGRPHDGLQHAYSNAYRETALHVASGGGHVGVTRLLLDRGADVHATDRTGSTPLHLASGAGVVSVLLRAGADIEARDYAGRTPLIDTAFRRDIDAVQELLAAGANPRARDNMKRTARWAVTRFAYDYDDVGAARACAWALKPWWALW